MSNERRLSDVAAILDAGTLRLRKRWPILCTGYRPRLMRWAMQKAISRACS